MPARRIPLVLGAALTLALLLTGCGAGSMDAGGASPAAAEASSAADGEGGSAADERSLPASTADFTAKTLDGKPFDATTVLAGKPTVIWFWSPGSKACLADAPGVQAVSARFGQQVTFVGIAGHGAVAAMSKFVSDTGLGGFPHLVDADGSLTTRFEVTGQPAFAFVNRDGAVRSMTGSLTNEELSARITALAQP